MVALIHLILSILKCYFFNLGTTRFYSMIHNRLMKQNFFQLPKVHIKYVEYIIYQSFLRALSLSYGRSSVLVEQVYLLQVAMPPFGTRCMKDKAMPLVRLPGDNTAECCTRR